LLDAVEMLAEIRASPVRMQATAPQVIVDAAR
jgi:hypothetical protein